MYVFIFNPTDCKVASFHNKVSPPRQAKKNRKYLLVPPQPFPAAEEKTEVCAIGWPSRWVGGTAAWPASTDRLAPSTCSVGPSLSGTTRCSWRTSPSAARRQDGRRRVSEWLAYLPNANSFPTSYPRQWRIVTCGCRDKPDRVCRLLTLRRANLQIRVCTWQIGHFILEDRHHQYFLCSSFVWWCAVRLW